MSNDMRAAEHNSKVIGTVATLVIGAGGYLAYNTFKGLWQSSPNIKQENIHKLENKNNSNQLEQINNKQVLFKKKIEGLGMHMDNMHKLINDKELEYQQEREKADAKFDVWHKDFNAMHKENYSSLNENISKTEALAADVQQIDVASVSDDVQKLSSDIALLREGLRKYEESWKTQTQEELRKVQELEYKISNTEAYFNELQDIARNMGSGNFKRTK